MRLLPFATGVEEGHPPDDEAAESARLDGLEEQAQSLTREVQQMRLQRELEQLDRSWETYRQKALRRDDRGQLIEPSWLRVKVSALLLAAGAIFIYVKTNGDLAWMALAVGLPLALAIAVIGGREAKSHIALRMRYEESRSFILQQMRKHGSTIPSIWNP